MLSVLKLYHKPNALNINIFYIGLLCSMFKGKRVTFQGVLTRKRRKIGYLGNYFVSNDAYILDA